VSNKLNDTTAGGRSTVETTSTGGASQTGSTAGATTTGAAGDQLLGTWALQVKTPFGQHPATLTLARGINGEATGAIKSQLGDGALSAINLDPANLSAVVSLTLQGRAYDARVAASIEDGQMSGTIKVNNLPIPAPALKFTGRKQQ
jgi:hypothetical protein